ncbi:YceI family protein [Nonlabens sp.]|uniref:YceI family protein n=1 Tax=Nonlabens sp. TaxID=1888209 RepID=UPI001BCEC768|nr:YceI family protein [Nonlabens sp.]
MKNIFILLLLSSLSLHAQKKVTKTGSIHFEASVPSFEPIQATNNSTTVVLDDQGNLAALVLIKGFRFPIALMQEHFNENYMESDDYPKATLRGALLNYENYLKDGSRQTLRFKGTLEMHGVINDIEIPVELVSTQKGCKLHADFKINPTDYKIDIPSVVRKKIADQIKVAVDATMLE